MYRTLKNLTVAAAVAGAIGVAVPSVSHAEVIQLGFILDESGSIGSGNYNTIKSGLASAIQNLVPLPGLNTYEISVVSFSDSATTLVNRVQVTNAASKTAIAAAINADTFTGGNTNYQAAFNLMRTILTTGGNLPTLSYVNFATDGDPTVPGNNDNQANNAGITARNALIAAGIDNISIEAIGTGVDATNLKNNYCYPGPCDSTVPYNFPTQGFFIQVADANGYANAIGNKILVVTQQTPEPASMAVLGIGLLGLGMVRRRLNRSA
jgi:uncharacterized protein YegL